MAIKSNNLKKSLTQVAKDNATVTTGKKSSQTVVKAGNPSDHSRKHLDGALPTVGVSVGITKNMDNYESLRADVWLTDVVREGENISEAYQRITEIANDVLQDIVSEYV